jgi:acyl dehydratase
MKTPYPDRIEVKCGPVSAVDLALFAAASGDHNPLHLDADVARGAGFERPVVHGMYTMACAGRLFTQHFGAGCVRALQTRFTGAALRGDTLEIEATLARVAEGVAFYEIKARNDNGAELMTGSARIDVGIA